MASDRTTGLAWVKVLPTDASLHQFGAPKYDFHGRHYNCQQYKINYIHGVLNVRGAQLLSVTLIIND